VLQQRIERRLEIDHGLAEVVLQHEVVEIEHLAQLCREAVALEEIGHAQGAARDLVFVRRADAATGGADGVRSARMLACPIEGHVRGQNERTARRDAQAIEHRHALVDQDLGFLEQRLERQHDAVADEAACAVPQDARGNQRQYVLLTADHQRVSGVVAALEARDGSRALHQQVDDLALAFIAPLRADDDDETH
jgi:hypothetical protein